MQSDLPSLPSFLELPVKIGAPPGSSWGLWGDDDKLGCLNLLTPATLAAAMKTVRDHRVFPLNAPMDVPGPPLHGRKPYEHVVTDTPSGHDEYLSGYYPQSSSQWDGFRHVRHPGYGFYNGISDEEHGMNIWAERGIAGRGILVDIGRYRRELGLPLEYQSADKISPEDLGGALDMQGTSVEPGDILVIRTGWMDWYKSISDERRASMSAGGVNGFSFPGLATGTSTSQFLWDLHIAALAADNPAVESWPRGWPASVEETAALLADPDRCESVFLHFSLLPLLGLPLGELWDLDALAAESAADGRYEFMLVAAPLNLPGGVGSPANVIAIR